VVVVGPAVGESPSERLPCTGEASDHGVARRLHACLVQGRRDPDRWLTVPHQREAIERWCADHDHRPAELRQDIDVSGASADRPNLEELVERVESGELGGVVVAKLDRFSRWLPYGVKIIERIDRAEGLFIAAADGFDLRKDEGRLQFHVMLSFADYELRRFRTNWRRARETLVL
jgi:site-specific DNA recombinase